MAQIYTVSEIITKLNKHYRGAFSFIWIEGEVINCSYSASGTIYFSLKEGNILLDCIWFPSKQQDIIAYDPLTGEVNETPILCVSKTIKNGDYLYVAGSIAIYQERSKFQLYVDIAQYITKGKYITLLEEKKVQLEREGLFEDRYKKNIPLNPDYIALITSKEGAALQDFLHVVASRGTGGKVLLYNCVMQGKDASDICRAIRDANKAKVKAIVIIRGGGSKEDISLFNDEQLVREIFASVSPVITGIGHEIDVTLVDYVADANGITPTFVGHMLFEERNKLFSRIQDRELVLYAYIQNIIDMYYASIARLSQKLYLAIEERLRYIKKEIIKKHQLVHTTLVEDIHQKDIVFSLCVQSYQYCRYMIGRHTISNVKYISRELSKNMYISYRDRYILYRTKKKAIESYNFFDILKSKLERLEYFLRRIHFAINNYIINKNKEFIALSTILPLVSPDYIMQKGYVCVENMNGQRITNVVSLTTSLLLHFSDGSVRVRIVSEEE